jgi:urease accessory protein
MSSEADLLIVDRLPTDAGRPPGAREVAVRMTAEERGKVRRRVTAKDGLTFALALPTGTRLATGQTILVRDGVHYVVEAESEDLLLVKTSDWRRAARAAHFIGNLHRDIDVKDEGVSALWDAVLAERLTKLGFEVERIRQPFLGKPSSGHSH